MHKEDFKKINIVQAQRLVEYGHDDKFIARFFGVTLNTWNYWKEKYPEFKKNYQDWKREADKRVERSLYRKAIGFTHVQEDKNEDGVVVDKRKFYYPPSDYAIKMWLTNRLPDDWKDKKEVANKSEVKIEGDLNVNKEDIEERIKDLVEDKPKKKKDTLEDALQ